MSLFKIDKPEFLKVVLCSISTAVWCQICFKLFYFSVFAQNKQKRSKGFVNVRDINQGNSNKRITVKTNPGSLLNSWFSWRRPYEQNTTTLCAFMSIERVWDLLAWSTTYCEVTCFAKTLFPKLCNKIVVFTQNDGNYRAGITRETCSFDSHFNSTPVGWATDPMKDPV